MGVFGGSTEIVPIRTNHVPQSIETPVSFVEVPGAYVRYAYARSSDSMSSGIDGQDFLCFRHNDQRFVGVVCDGVGSSFCGNLAARILGENLLDWLWSLDILYVNGQAALQESAASFLNKLQKQAQVEVDEYEIPAEIGGLVRQALEAQRSYGSEAVFAACRIDHPSPAAPNGLISILWMGDTTIRVLDDAGEALDLGGRFENSDRWSSTRGVRAATYAWMQELDGVGRVLIFTDGLAAHNEALHAYSDDRLDREIRAGQRLPSSDDVALLDVVLRSPAYEGYPDLELPDPAQERPHLDPIWNPTGGDSFELRWSWPGKGKASFLVQEASSPALTDARTFEPGPNAMTWQPPAPREPGHYYYRVRALSRWGRISPWSGLRQTRVAYPPPATPTLEAAQPGAAPTLRWSDEGETISYRLVYARSEEFEESTLAYEGSATSWAPPTGALKPGEYFFRVRAISDGGESAWSAVQRIEVLMPPPPRPHLSGVSYDALRDGYVFRWQGVPGATHYELRRIDEAGEEMIGEVHDTSCLVTELEPGSYSFALRACHTYGCSEWSDVQTITISPPAPTDAPLLALDGPDEDGHIHLHWDAVTGAASYTVEIAEDPTFRHARMHSTTANELPLVRREPGALHFRVCAENSGGSGPWSETARIAINPPAPAWIEATRARIGRRVHLAWGASGGRVEYTVQYTRRVEERIEAHEVYHGPDTQCTVEMPQGGGALSFRVRAELPGVMSDWTVSESVGAAPALEPPALGTPERQEDGTYRLHWSRVEGAEYYLVEIARESTFSRVIRSLKAQANSGTFTPPGPGEYYIRVAACQDGNGDSCSLPSGAVRIEVTQAVTPTLFPVDAVGMGQRFEIAWRGVPGTAAYELQGAPENGFAQTNSRTWRIEHPAQKCVVDVQTGGAYFFRVRAVPQEGDPGPWSDVLQVEVR